MRRGESSMSDPYASADDVRVAPLLDHIRPGGLAYNTPEWAEIVSDFCGFED